MGSKLSKAKESRKAAKAKATAAANPFAETPKDFKITVKNAAGEVLSLDVVSTDTVLSLKEKIREAQGIPVAQQRLEFTPIEYNWKSTKLSRNEAKLSEVSMTDGAELHLTVKVLGEGPMELIVRAITGTEYIIEVEKTDTILKFKENLQDFSGINPDQQILSTKEKGKLDNDKTVADYGLEDGALVDLKLILLF